MLEIPTLRQLATQAEEDLRVEADGRIRPAIQAALAWALAGLAYLYLLALRFLSRNLFLDTADEAYALQHASIDGVEPLPAIPSKGSAQATGTNGSIVTAGTLLERADGARYSVDTEATVVAGEVVLSLTAVIAGVAGDLEAGQALTFVSTPVGLDAETTVMAPGIIGGADVETPAETQARALARRRARRRGGSEDDYEVWAREASVDVANAWATGSYQGIGTVLVIVAQDWDPTIDGETPVPTPALISTVASYIDLRKPAGLWLVTVQGPTLYSLDPEILLSPDTPAIRTAVEKALARHLATVEPGGLVYYDDLVDAINRAIGEDHHLLRVPAKISLVLGVNNVQLDAGELAVPGTIDWGD